MDESSPDLITKYQKLAAEYSKMRAQTTVLKKAIAEEQTKGSEMKETFKEKDQAIRKLEQEVECLNFRNLQLTKRVSVLQDDLEAIDDKSKKTKNKVLSSNPAPVPSETHSILNAELLSRIEENEKLHHQVYASEVEHKKIVEDLTATVESLQNEMTKQHSSMSEAIKKHEATIDKLSQERAKMEVTLKNYEKELKDTKLNEEICKEELQFVRDDLGHKLEEKKRIIEEKILFNDTRQKFQNNLNVPVLLRRKHDQLSSSLVDLGGFVSELVRRLSDLHTYMEQKINSLEPDVDVCGPIKKFGSFLHENAQYLKAIEVAFADFVARIQNDPSAWLEAFSLKGISKALSRYVRYLDKLLPYLLLSIQAENCTKGTTPRLEETHKRLQVVAEGLTYGFSKLERCFQLLVEIASPEKNGVYCVSQSVLVRRIITCLHCLHMSFEEARKVFSSKVVLEHQMPTSTEKMKSTDDCILSSLVSVVTGIKKITILMEDNAEVLMCEVPYRPRGLLSQKKLNINSCVSTLRERGSKYMILTKSDEPLSVPYELAMKNSQSLQNFADTRENLTQQLSTCKNKLSKLEQDKEYWMLECQLLQAKQSRTGNSPTQDDFDISSEDGQALQSFLKESVNQLVTQIQFADSKSVAFHTECAFLQQKLQLAEQKRDALEKENSGANNVISRLKEEHKTMMKSYEDQLSMMSEHLATMNETLTLQKDEIDALRQAGTNKASKKLKGK